MHVYACTSNDSKTADRFLVRAGNSPEAVDTARNKHAARACMESAGLPTPLNFLIKSDAQLADAAAHVGFPAVIKPISGAASIGVIRVNDVEQLKKSFARCFASPDSLRIKYYFPQAQKQLTIILIASELTCLLQCTHMLCTITCVF